MLLTASVILLSCLAALGDEEALEYLLCETSLEMRQSPAIKRIMFTWLLSRYPEDPKTLLPSPHERLKWLSALSQSGDGLYQQWALKHAVKYFENLFISDAERAAGYFTILDFLAHEDSAAIIKDKLPLLLKYVAHYSGITPDQLYNLSQAIFRYHPEQAHHLLPLLSRHFSSLPEAQKNERPPHSQIEEKHADLLVACSKSRLQDHRLPLLMRLVLLKEVHDYLKRCHDDARDRDNARYAAFLQQVLLPALQQLQSQQQFCPHHSYLCQELATRMDTTTLSSTDHLEKAQKTFYFYLYTQQKDAGEWASCTSTLQTLAQEELTVEEREQLNTLAKEAFLWHMSNGSLDTLSYACELLAIPELSQALFKCLEGSCGNKPWLKLCQQLSDQGSMVLAWESACHIEAQGAYTLRAHQRLLSQLYGAAQSAKAPSRRCLSSQLAALDYHLKLDLCSAQTPMRWLKTIQVTYEYIMALPSASARPPAILLKKHLKTSLLRLMRQLHNSESFALLNTILNDRRTAHLLGSKAWSKAMGAWLQAFSQQASPAMTQAMALQLMAARPTLPDNLAALSLQVIHELTAYGDIDTCINHLINLMAKDDFSTKIYSDFLQRALEQIKSDELRVYYFGKLLTLLISRERLNRKELKLTVQTLKSARKNNIKLHSVNLPPHSYLFSQPIAVEKILTLVYKVFTDHKFLCLLEVISSKGMDFSRAFKKACSRCSVTDITAGAALEYSFEILSEAFLRDIATHYHLMRNFIFANDKTEHYLGALLNKAASLSPPNPLLYIALLRFHALLSRNGKKVESICADLVKKLGKFNEIDYAKRGGFFPTALHYCNVLIDFKKNKLSDLILMDNRQFQLMKSGFGTSDFYYIEEPYVKAKILREQLQAAIIKNDLFTLEWSLDLATSSPSFFLGDIVTARLIVEGILTLALRHGDVNAAEEYFSALVWPLEGKAPSSACSCFNNNADDDLTKEAQGLQSHPLLTLRLMLISMAFQKFPMHTASEEALEISGISAFMNENSDLEEHYVYKIATSPFIYIKHKRFKEIIKKYYPACRHWPLEIILHEGNIDLIADKKTQQAAFDNFFKFLHSIIESADTTAPLYYVSHFLENFSKTQFGRQIEGPSPIKALLNKFVLLLRNPDLSPKLESLYDINSFIILMVNLNLVDAIEIAHNSKERKLLIEFNSLAVNFLRKFHPRLFLPNFDLKDYHLFMNKFYNYLTLPKFSSLYEKENKFAEYRQILKYFTTEVIYPKRDLQN